MSNRTTGLADISHQALRVMLGNRVYNLPIFTLAQATLATDPAVVYSHGGVMYSADISGQGTLVADDNGETALPAEYTSFYAICLPENSAGTGWLAYKGNKIPGDARTAIPDGLGFPSVPDTVTCVGLIAIYNEPAAADFIFQTTALTAVESTIWNISCLPAPPAPAA